MKVYQLILPGMEKFFIDQGWLIPGKLSHGSLYLVGIFIDVIE